MVRPARYGASASERTRIASDQPRRGRGFVSSSDGRIRFAPIRSEHMTTWEGSCRWLMCITSCRSVRRRTARWMNQTASRYANSATTVSKEWPGQEKQHASSLALRGKGPVILGVPRLTPSDQRAREIAGIDLGGVAKRSEVKMETVRRRRKEDPSNVMSMSIATGIRQKAVLQRTASRRRSSSTWTCHRSCMRTGDRRDVERIRHG